MYRMLFRSRWAALLFVAITIASAAAFVGSSEGESAATELATNMRAQAQAKLPFAAEDVNEAARQSELIHGFASEEELVDDATGLDPTPEDELARIEAELAAQDEPTIVANSDQIAAPGY
ncbi:MAG: hypothetical protein AB7G24_09295 [Novosphingobium sp.]